MKFSRRNLLEAAALSALPGRAAPERPNIILLLGDDHRRDAAGCYGNRLVQTPELDRLAGEGVLFENHFTTTPICCASRASIMLGEYAGSHGINDFETPLRDGQVARSYWRQLAGAGYHTGFIGKFGVGAKMPAESFDVWMGFGGQGHYFPHGPEGPHLNHIVRDQIHEFLDSAPAGRPFCLSVSFKAPHEEDEDPRTYLPSQDTAARYAGVTFPEHGGAGSDDINRFPLAIQRSENRRRWAGRYSTPALNQATKNGYYRLITGIDDVIGSMRKKLGELGLARNTIILYSADHGIFEGEHGFAGKWYGHEEPLAIPLIVYDPRLPADARGKRVRATSLNIDLQPTLLDLAGVRADAPAQGQSLARYLKDSGSSGRGVFFFEHRFPYRGWIPSSEGIRTARWKYIRYTDAAAPFEELYDLQANPKETVNLAGNPEYRRQSDTLDRYARTWRGALSSWRPGTPWIDPVSGEDLRRDGLV